MGGRRGDATRVRVPLQGGDRRDLVSFERLLPHRHSAGDLGGAAALAHLPRALPRVPLCLYAAHQFEVTHTQHSPPQRMLRSSMRSIARADRSDDSRVTLYGSSLQRIVLLLLVRAADRSIVLYIHTCSIK